MRPQEYVAANVWEDFRFAGTKASRSKRLDWSDAELVKLLGTPWRIAAVPSEAYAWMTLLAMFTGMRAEEIARLRSEDVAMVDGVPVFLVQEHPDGWSPKTEAGARAVPVHPRLQALGVLDLVERRRAERALRLVAGLKPGGPDQKLSHGFSRAFSRHKVKAGVAGRTVFHSFRHSVSTMLRNEAAEIRGEWIDALLGHEGGSKSQGATTYLKRIGVANLARTMAALTYAPAVLDAAGKLVGITLPVPRRARQPSAP